MAIVCLHFALLGYGAQLTATLQSGQTFTPFYGDSAFVKAYNAALDGDVITLSAGEFKTPVEIKKTLTILGNYAFTDTLSKATYLHELFLSGDNISLEGIRTNWINIRSTNNLSIKRCRINSLSDFGDGHINTSIIDCYVAGYGAMAFSQNTVIRNCNITYFYNSMNNKTYPALIENCNIVEFSQYDGGIYRNIQPYAIYRNCYLGLYGISRHSFTANLSFSAPSEFYNNIFGLFYKYSAEGKWELDFSSTVAEGNNQYFFGEIINDIEQSTYFGSFKQTTVDGLTVGPVDHKDYPAIPVINSAEIDTETDSEGNIHVKINASARD